MSTNGVAATLRATGERLQEFFSAPPVPSRRAQRVLVAACIAVFLVAAAGAATRLPAPPGELRWWLLIPVALLGVPGSVVVNALEFRVSARMAGTNVELVRAITVMVIARAASLLPLPGGTIVRIGALKQTGATYPRSLVATGAVGLTWVGATLLAAGALLVTVAADDRGWLAILAGTGAVALTMLLMVPDHGVVRAGVLGFQALAAGFGMVVVGMLRLTIILMALGYPISFAQAAVLTIAEVLAMAMAIVPGGIGVREVVAGVLGAAVGLPASLGVLATVGDRLLEYLVLAPVAVAMWFRLRPSLNGIAEHPSARESDVT